MASNLGSITNLELNWKGSYSSTYTYTKKDLVYYGGDSFECLVTTSLGVPPTNSTNWVYSGRGQDLLVNGGSLAYYSREGQSGTSSMGFGSFLMHNGIKGTLVDPFVISVKIKDWGGAGVAKLRFQLNDKIRFVNPIELERGRTYKFDQTDSSNAGHPLYIGLTPKYAGVTVDTGTSDIVNPFVDGTNLKYYIDGSEVTQTQYHTTVTFNAASTSRWIIWTITNVPADVLWYESSQEDRVGQPLHIVQGPNRLVTMNRMRGNLVHKKITQLQGGPPGGWFPYMPTRTRWIANQKEQLCINCEANASINQLGDVLTTGTNMASAHHHACYEASRAAFPFWYRGAKHLYPTGSLVQHMIDIDGNLWQWGGNDTVSYRYALANDNTTNTNSRQQVPNLVTFDGKCPGPNGRYDSSGDYKVIDIRGDAPYYEDGYESSGMVLMGNGDIWTWGHNEQGNLGKGTTSTVDVKPAKIEGSYDMLGACHGGDNTHRGGFFARDRITGKLWAWGANADGQLGVGDTTARHTPTLVNLPTDRFAVKVLGGGGDGSTGYESDTDPGRTTFAYFLLDDGSLYSCGDNNIGNLGHGDTTARSTPEKIVGLETNVRDFFVFGGGRPTCVAMLKDGTIRTWGHNYNGECGIGTSTNYYTSPQNPIFTKNKKDSINYNSVVYPPIVEMAGCGWDGYSSIYALKADGTVWSCGENHYGRLGRHGMHFGDRSEDRSEANIDVNIWIDDDAPTSVKNSVFGDIQGLGNTKITSLASWTDSENNGCVLMLSNEGDVWGVNLYHNEAGGEGANHRMGIQRMRING